MAARKARKDSVRKADGVYLRASGNYEVREWRDGKTIYHTLRNCKKYGCTHTPIRDLQTAKKAKVELDQRKADEKLLGSGQARRTKTVGEWATEWLVLFPRARMATNRHNAERISTFVKAFENMPMRYFDTDEGVQAAMAWGTQNTGRVREVRTFFNDAVRARLLTGNPLRHFRLGQRDGRRDITALKPAEIDRLVVCAREEWGQAFGPTMEAMILLAAWTGARPGELFLFSLEPGARVNFVDRKAGVVHIDWQSNTKEGGVTRPKWNSVRTVPLLPAARAAIDAWLRDGPGYDGGLMFKTKRGSVYTGRTHHYYWDPVRRAFAASLPAEHWLRRRIADAQARDEDDNLDFYELRHFFGSTLANPPAGVTAATPYQIAKLMGHKDGGKLAMKLYIHTDGQEAVDAVAGLWEGAGAQRRAS